MRPQAKRQLQTNELMKECQVFWAFDTKRFEEEKAKLDLKEGDKIVHIGASGYMPASRFQELQDGLTEIAKEFKEAMKDAKARRAHILHELHNHEAWETGDIEDTLEALGEGFTYEEVLAIFKKKK